MIIKRFKISFDKLSFDGFEATDHPHNLHRFVGNFFIITEGEIVFSEQEFCLVEFALALKLWCNETENNQKNFSYQSVESELDSLIWFTLKSEKTYSVESVYENRGSRDQFSRTQTLVCG